jgi:porin
MASSQASAADCSELDPKSCRGWSVEAGYTADLLRNASGGLDTGNAYLDGLDVIASVDAERAFGWSGVRLHGHVQYNNGAGFSGTRVGDAQSVSNIEGVGTWRVYELWADVQFGADEAPQSLRFGLYDLNSEFDSIDTAGLFLNASHGIGPEYAQSGLNGPSIFPVTSLALRLRRESVHSYWQLAALDAVPGDRDDPARSGVHLSGDEGALFAGEWGMARGRLTKLALGAWSYTGRFDSLADVDPTSGALAQRRGNRGVYALVDVAIGESDGRRLDAFARVGVAEDKFNAVANYLGAGVVLSAPLSGRPDDQLGLAVATAGTGNAMRRLASGSGASLQRRETTVELTYRASLTDWLTVQPDIQYVRQPGFDPGLQDAWVIGLRLEFSGALER